MYSKFIHEMPKYGFKLTDKLDKRLKVDINSQFDLKSLISKYFITDDIKKEEDKTIEEDIGIQ